MNTNNDVWREVEKGRADDARHWRQREQFIRQARAAEHDPGRKIIPGVGTMLASVLFAIQKGLASLRQTTPEPREPMREKPKSYA